MKNSKIKNTCEYCGKLGSCNTFIHKKCCIDWLKSQGYEIIKFKSPVTYLEEMYKK